MAGLKVRIRPRRLRVVEMGDLERAVRAGDGDRAPVLLAAPNVSEGRDRERIEAIAVAFAGGVELLDLHSDRDHNRSVLTLAGAPGALAGALEAGARAAADAIDMNAHQGLHPCVGALDVCPVIWLRDSDRETAHVEARRVAERIATGLSVPVLLYGELASAPERRERAFFRRGGLAELRRRMRAGELRPDYGPAEPHPSAGATLVTARPPLAAFNLELEGVGLEETKAVASRLRESSGGLRGVRAIGLELARGRMQISTNVHDPIGLPLAAVVERTRELAAGEGGTVVAAELVGLAPDAALRGFPDDLPMPGFDPNAHVIERRLARIGGPRGSTQPTSEP